MCWAEDVLLSDLCVPVVFRNKFAYSFVLLCGCLLFLCTAGDDYLSIGLCAFHVKRKSVRIYARI